MKVTGPVWLELRYEKKEYKRGEGTQNLRLGHELDQKESKGERRGIFKKSSEGSINMGKQNGRW